jgi:hypothetical protein
MSVAESENMRLCKWVMTIQRKVWKKFLLITNLMHFFHVFIYSFHLSTCLEHQMFIIRRSNCINTSSGMISLCRWLLGMPVPWVCRDRHTKQSPTQTNHTWWCINAIRSPDDEHLMLETCREMKGINKCMEKCIRLVINKNLWRDARSIKY